MNNLTTHTHIQSLSLTTSPPLKQSLWGSNGSSSLRKCDNSARLLMGTCRTWARLKFNSWGMFRNNVQLATIPPLLTRGGFHDIRTWSFGRFNHSAFDWLLLSSDHHFRPIRYLKLFFDPVMFVKIFLLLLFELKVILLELREVRPTWNKLSLGLRYGRSNSSTHQ